MYQHQTTKIKLPKLDVSFYNDNSVMSLMRSRGILLDGESIESVFKRVLESLLYYDALEEKIVDLAFTKKIIQYTTSGVFAFGTPILTNAGRKSLPTTACTVISVPKFGDDLDVENFRKKSLFMLNQAIGIGYDLSEFSNPSKVLKVMNAEIQKINTLLVKRKKRPAACMATLRMDHPDILQFIQAKDSEDFSSWTFNISVLVTEELFSKAKKDQSINLIDQRTKQIKASLPAKMLLEKIAASAHLCGEPGILFIDRFEKESPTPQLGYISTAPCAEVALAEGEFCQFSYINVKNLIRQLQGKKIFDTVTFADAVQTLLRLIDGSVSLSIEALAKSGHADLIKQKRRVGISITGFAELLVGLEIAFSSEEALLLAAQIGELLSFHTMKASVELAKKRGYFPSFPESMMTQEQWLRKNDGYHTGIIDPKEWNNLYQDILRYGLRNASLVSFPPTGTSSQLVQTTTSFEPFYTLTNPTSSTTFKGKEVPDLYSSVSSYLKSISRTEDEYTKKVDSIYDSGGMHVDISSDQSPILATAREISPSNHLKMQSKFQNFSDESSSKTINLPNTATKNDILNCIWDSYALNLKGFTVFRDGCLEERIIV